MRVARFLIAMCATATIATAAIVTATAMKTRLVTGILIQAIGGH